MGLLRQSGIEPHQSKSLKDPQTTHTYIIIILFIALIGLGMLNLYSASIGSGAAYFNTQLRNLIVGMSLFVFVGWIVPLRVISDQAIPIYIFTCVLLLLVLVLGRISGGSQRWINLPFMSFQPSEFAKISMAVIVARFFFQKKIKDAYGLNDLFPILIGIGIIFGLIFQQPDLGTAGVCLIIAVVQILFVPLNPKSVWISVSAAIASGIIGWNFLLRPYQKLRILNLLNPNLDPAGSGYNSLQSLVAIGSGGPFGKGFEQGTQTQLKFLPAKHTDFVFSVFAEEHGFIGGVLVILLFVSLTYVALEVARKSKDIFNALFAIGIATILFSQFTINVAMVLGIFPVVGLPLPLFSYGGSSLITICITIGFLVAIDRDTIRTSKLTK